MAFAKVNSNSTNGLLWSDSTHALALPAGATADNLIVVVVRIPDETTTFNTPTDDAGSTYTSAGTVSHSDGGLNARILLWFAVALAGAQTVTITTGSSIGQFAEFAIAQFSGNVTSSVQDGSAVTTTNDGDTNHTATGLTTTTTNSLLIGASEDDNFGETYTLDGAFTVLDSGQFHGDGTMGYRILSATGTYGITNTSSDFTDAVTILVAFKGTGGGGGGGGPVVYRGWLAA